MLEKTEDTAISNYSNEIKQLSSHLEELKEVASSLKELSNREDFLKTSEIQKLQAQLNDLTDRMFKLYEEKEKHGQNLKI